MRKRKPTCNVDDARDILQEVSREAFERLVGNADGMRVKVPSYALHHVSQYDSLLPAVEITLRPNGRWEYTL